MREATKNTVLKTNTALCWLSRRLGSKSEFLKSVAAHSPCQIDALDKCLLNWIVWESEMKQDTTQEKRPNRAVGTDDRTTSFAYI